MQLHRQRPTIEAAVLWVVELELVYLAGVCPVIVCVVESSL